MFKVELKHILVIFRIFDGMFSYRRNRSYSMFFLFRVGLSLTKRAEWLHLGHVSAVFEPFGLSCYFLGSSAQSVAEYLVLCSWS